ncbi:hypothetical protein [Hyphomonas atlantica]|uniref:hypothetical protein n=1 Tax=Hyphomonas atlantica TaxID=1280948 RepID=UPI00355A3271
MFRRRSACVLTDGDMRRHWATLGDTERRRVTKGDLILTGARSRDGRDWGRALIPPQTRRILPPLLRGK